MQPEDPEPAVPLILPLTAAANLESELLARFSEPYVSRTIRIRRLGTIAGAVAVAFLSCLAILFWMGQQTTAACQMAGLLLIALPATLEKHFELRRLIQARAEIRRRRGLADHT
ncbi:hypothetical protein [Caulobacter sp. X]|uniref:hypothetical protein n=1 Tax=Caulobacter sp. X TaxID=2048901 RepID=UPI000C1537CA|nr:hypothetical protein [Caulobacter sp. X]PIB95357.1 hypothetical protein CSW60_22700 [Caulobacter sp. X]